MSCPAAKRIALVMRSSIFSRSTPIAFSFRSEIGDSITDAGTPSSTSASRSAGTAREKPHTRPGRPLGVGGPPPREAPPLRVQAGLRDEPHRLPVVLRHAREAGLDPVDPE